MKNGLQKDELEWLKVKGYRHITKNIDVRRSKRGLIKKIKDEKFVASYAFYPLIHTVIKERKYKKIKGTTDRGHSYWKNDIKESNAKLRPLHYATHFDSLILSYYAHKFQNLYEEKLKSDNDLSQCIIAYRKIKIDEHNPDSKGKSTIHFSKEVFDEVKNRAISNEKELSVLTFDIKSFFPTLNHEYLEKMLCLVSRKSQLNSAEKNVFRATTQFSYILLDELRVGNKKNGRKEGFDEKKLSRIRREHGINAFFESPEDFRKSLKNRDCKIYKNPFRNKTTKELVGIPQGLPNSAVFANIYLYEFDKMIYEHIVQKMGGYYRRYSDDIIIISERSQVDMVKDVVYNLIEFVKLEASKEKTEEFVFNNAVYNKTKEERLTCFKLVDNKKLEAPLIYLGFEFRGYNTRIKASNVSKFYRRMIYAVKRKARRIAKEIKNNPYAKKAIFLNQIKPIFLNYSLHKKPSKRKKRVFELNYKGEFDVIYQERENMKKSNFYSYSKRAAEIMGEEGIKKQFRKIRSTMFSAIKRNLDKL